MILARMDSTLPGVLAKLSAMFPLTRAEVSHPSSAAQLATLESAQLDVAIIRERCDFCGKRPYQVTGLAVSVGNPAGKHGGDAAICAECLVLCSEIHSEQLN